MATTTDNGMDGTTPVRDEGAAKVDRQASATRRTAYALLATAGLVTVVGLVYAYRTGIRFGLVRAQQIHAAMEVKVEAALGHLWFEEILSGDRREDMSEVWRHYDSAEWYARAMLEGGENEMGSFFPLDDPAMRQAMENVVRDLAKLRKATARRWELRGAAVAGTALDLEYDRAFIAGITSVELHLLEHTATDVSSFRWTFAALVAINVILYAAGGATLWRSAEQRRLAERALAASEKNLQITLNSIGDAVIATDAEGRVTRMNPVAVRLTGWAQEEVTGRQLSEVFNIVNELTRQEVENPVARVLREGTIVGLANHTLLIAKDGTERPIADSGAPIVEEDGGEIRGVVLVFRDQTEERRAQRRIEHLNQVLRAIRNVNQLITTERGRDALLQGACRCLTETRGFQRAWIAVLDEAGRAAASAESGIGGGFRRLTERLEAGTLPACAERALAHADVVTTEEAASACADCPLEKSHTRGSAITSRLESAGKVYGVMSVSVPAQSLSDSEELTLARELASDIGLALHSISLEEDRKRAEEALRESELRFRRLFELAPIGIGLATLDGKPVDANEAMAAITGYSREELMDVDLRDTYEVPEDRATLLDALKRQGRVSDFRTRLRRKDGTSYDASLNISVVRLGSEEVFQTICVDVSERKRAEEALRESEHRYRTFVQNFRGIAFRGDMSFKPMFFHGAVEEITGYSEEDFTVGALRWDQVIHPDDLKAIFLARDKLQTVGNYSTEREYRIMRKDGQTRWVHEVIQNVCDDSGRPAFVEGVIHDVTERKRAEHEIRMQSEIAANMSEGVYLVRASDWLIVYANPRFEELFGYAPSEMLGKHVSIVNCPGDKTPEETAEEIAAFIAEHGYWRGEINNVKKDGTPFWCRASVSTFDHPEHGEVFVSVHTDITEHKQLEDQLRHTQKMEAIGTLAGGIAHDFNNMLQGILGYANLLKLRSPDDKKVFKAADVIERAGTRAAELTQQLLGFARKGKLRNMPVDIHRTIGNTVAILARTVDKQIAMTQRLGAKPSVVKGDPGQLEQVIMNLALNARDAMPEGGELTFETSLVDCAEGCCEPPPDAAQGKCLLLSVTDTGVGMTPEVRERIFEPFYTTKPQGEGTGMGLAMVYGIVRNHGGSVVVHSDPGKGATFDIYLPLAEKGARITDTQKLKAIVRGSGRVLVVDDEETVRDILTEMLTSLGYEVRCACDGREAVEHYLEHANEIDLVVLDMTMPVMSGPECFEELRKINPDVKAVVATGHALDGAAQETINAGALRFIHKPFVMAELAETVAKALAK